MFLVFPEETEDENERNHKINQARNKNKIIELKAKIRDRIKGQLDCKHKKEIKLYF